jgi:hypothetical protein
MTTTSVIQSGIGAPGMRPPGIASAPPRPRPAALRRPGGRPMSYAQLPGRVRLSRAPHYPTRRQRRRRVAALIALAVLVTLTAWGMGAVRSSGVAEVPTATTVVQVQSGENLSELAARVAPGVPASAVVQRIVSLNGLSGPAVRTGQSLVVPTR